MAVVQLQQQRAKVTPWQVDCQWIWVLGFRLWELVVPCVDVGIALRRMYSALHHELSETHQQGRVLQQVWAYAQHVVRLLRLLGCR